MNRLLDLDNDSQFTAASFKKCDVIPSVTAITVGLQGISLEAGEESSKEAVIVLLFFIVVADSFVKPVAEDKQIEKELQRQIVKFEESVKEGQYYDSNMRFGDYGEEWLELNRPPQLAPKTCECYRGMFRDIKEALGDIKLVKLQSRHLQMFYSNLRENGVKRTGAYAVSDNIDDIRKEMQLFKDKFAALYIYAIQSADEIASEALDLKLNPKYRKK